MNEFKNLWFFIATFAGIIIFSLPFVLPDNNSSVSLIIQAIQLSLTIFVFILLVTIQIKKKIRPKPAIDFKEYIRKLANFRGTKELGLKRIIDYYISLNGLNLEDDSYITNLDAYLINDWIEEDSSNGMLLLGTTGSGKSTIFEYIAVNVARKWLRSSNKNRVPIIVDLRLLKDYGSLKNTILATLEKLNLKSESGKLWDSFTEMNKDGKILLLLDGFDETFDARVNYNELHRHFNDITSLIEPLSKMKVILSTRPEVFLSMKELQEIILLRIKTNLDDSNELERRIRIDKGETSFVAIKILPVKSKQIRDYLIRRFGSAGNIKWQKIKEFNQLIDLARRPVTLDMVAMTVDEITDTISLLTLYNVYTNQWFKREIKKRALLQPELKRELITEISWIWLKSSNRTISYSKMFEIKNKLEKRTNIDISLINYIVEDLVKSSFFKHASSQREYTFQHKSFAEYFVAKNIAESKDNYRKKKLIEEFWRLDYVSQQGILAFSSKELYRAIIEDNTPFINGKREIKKIWLMTWVKLHQIDPLVRIRLPKQDIEEEVVVGTSSYIIKYEDGVLKRLDLSNLEISYLPENIFMMYPALKTLILSKNCLKKLPETINRQDDLETLLLDKNMFTKIPSNIIDLKNLRELNLEENNIEEIIDSFTFQSESLNILSLANNNLKSVPLFISNLKNLQSLDLNGNKVKKIPEFLVKMKLKRLCITDNFIQNFPEEIGNMKDLLSLEFSGLFLDEIPSFIGSMNLKRLKIKDISNNSIPKFISEMKELQVLELSGFQPKRLLEYIKTTKNLESEDITIKTPNLIHYIKNKDNLDKILEINKIKEFPTFISELKELRRLYLEGFSLLNEQIPNFLKDIDLLSISLKNNKITKIPTNICKTNLNKIDLSENEITTLAEISYYDDLRVINLGYNKIENLSEEILKFKNLRYLDLSNNFLEEIPYWINKLSELRVLILSGNKIQKIPENILSMPKLRIFDIDQENLEENSRFIYKDFRTLQSTKMR